MNDFVMHGKTFQPVEYKVLVKPDLVEETDDAIKRFKVLGMELPEAEKQRDKMKQITGTLLAAGGRAFEDFGDPSPAIGDKVYFAKYAGMILESDDKIEYRLMSDKDITAVLI
jgi:co-chaperonin GroES (HSP10)